MDRDEIAWRADWLKMWPGAHWLVEPGLGSSAGMPDAYLVADLFDPGWVEFKKLEGDGTFLMRPSQTLWIRRFTPYCRRVAIVVLIEGGGYWAVPGIGLGIGEWGTRHAPEGIGGRYYPSPAHLPLVLEQCYARG